MKVGDIEAKQHATYNTQTTIHKSLTAPNNEQSIYDKIFNGGNKRLSHKGECLTWCSRNNPERLLDPTPLSFPMIPKDHSNG